MVYERSLKEQEKPKRTNEGAGGRCPTTFFCGPPPLKEFNLILIFSIENTLNGSLIEGMSPIFKDTLFYQDSLAPTILRNIESDHGIIKVKTVDPFMPGPLGLASWGGLAFCRLYALATGLQIKS